MPRPDISVPKPNQTFYEAVFGNVKPASTILVLSLILIALVVGSLNPTATVISCVSVIAIVSITLIRANKATETVK